MKPVMDIDGEELVVMFDTPHLLKNAKNMLTKHNAFFEGKIASFSHIKKLYEIDYQVDPRLVPKLTDNIVNLAPFKNMNVAQAARTLSSSVASGIEYYVQSGDLSLGALGTASFADFHDKLFDSFNSRGVASSSKVGHKYSNVILTYKFKKSFNSH